MGEVYRARDARLDRGVAIKVLPADVASSPDRLARFERETKLVAALSHPNVLSVFDVGTFEGTGYAVFELLEGETLRGRVAAGVLPARRAVEIAVGIARGLAAAHAKGIVHRDLKPENVFLSRDGGVKVLDFGLARQDAAPALAALSQLPTEERLTEAGTVLGTAGYMSPEQVRGAKTDGRSDLFSLGCVLYEMLGGRRPFAGGSVAETLAAVLREEPAPLPAPEPLPGLERVVRRCLEKDPAHRFQTADDLAFALEGLLGAPSDAGRATVGESPAGGRRRIRAWLGAAGAFGLLAVGIVVGHLLAARAKPADAPTFERLSFRRGSVFQARFGPDGQTVFYSAAFEGEPPEVYETRIGSADARPLGLSPARLLAVSSAGEMAVAMRPVFPLSFWQPGRLGRLPLTGGVPREMVDDVNAADWTADGKDLLVVRGLGGRTRIEWPLGTTFFESASRIGSLRLSPRGDRVAFFEYGPSTDVVLLDRAGVRTVLSGGWQLPSGGLAWSPDGREVWFTAQESYTSGLRLWAAGIDGTRRQVLHVPGGVRLHDVAFDGRVLLSQLNFRLSLYVGGDAAGTDRDLSWFGWSTLNDLSADGRRLLFADVGGAASRPWALLLRPSDGGKAVRLGDGFYTFSGRISPDGRWVAAGIGAPDGTVGALRVEPTGAGEARTLPAGGLAHPLGWAWLPDGSAVVVAGSRSNETGCLAEQRLDGSPPRFLSSRCEGGDPVVSPDGRLVACTSAKGIELLPRDGSSPREIASSEPLGNLIRWGSDGRAVYSYRPGDMPGAVLRTDLATGRVAVHRRLQPADPAGIWRIHPVSVTPDGKRWAYSASRWLGDLYVYSGLR
jgi:Tol biopolymer transport system component